MGEESRMGCRMKMDGMVWCAVARDRIGPMSSEVNQAGDNGGEDRSIVNVALISAINGGSWL
jgi:hypothetical protein